MKNLFAGLGLFAALTLGAWAAETAPLTEAEALRQGLNRPEVRDVARGTVGLAQADAVEAGLIPNPRLDYQRDRTTGSATRIEATAPISQTFDVAGKRRLRHEAAERRVLAVQSDTEARRLEVETAELERVRERLLALLGRSDALDPGRTVAGSLLPSTAPDFESLLPRLQALAALKALEERAAARAMVAETTALDLEWKARFSRIELDQLIGMVTP